MPGSPTTPGRPSARVGALGHIAFHYTDSVGTRDQFSIAAQWLACTFPCRRFADILADACARLGADVGRYSFIAVDLHHLLLKKFADFLGRSADKAIAEDVHCYQCWLASTGTAVSTANVAATALRFFFKVTLKRHDLAQEVVSTREPRRLPVVLSPEEVGRLLASATNIKHKALLSLAYATGLRASEVVSLKLTDIDHHRMVIRVEQGK